MDALRIDSCHQYNFFDLLPHYRMKSQFCDIVLKIQDSEFPAHKLILSTYSPFFEAMFNGNFPESDEKIIELHDLDEEVFDCIMAYMYSGRLQIQEKFVIQLFQTADFLQMQWLKSQCRHYLGEIIGVNNCISIMKLANLHDLHEITEESVQYANENLDKISTTKDFLALEVSDVINLLGEDNATQGQNEKIITAITRWVKHDLDDRKEYLVDLLKLVHTHCLGGKFLRKTIAPESVFRINREASDWLENNFPNMKPHNTSHARYKHIFALDSNTNFVGFNVESKKFTRLANNITPQRYSSVSYKDSIYIFSGVCNQTAFKYDIVDNEWDTIAFPTYSCSEAACVIGDSVLFTGGYFNAEWYNTLCQYDFVGNKIINYQRMKIERTLHGVAAHDSCVYVCGGSHFSAVGEAPLCIAERMDIREGTWNILHPMANAHKHCTSAIVSDIVYCCDVDTGETERFDWRTSRWEALQQAPGRQGSLVACDGKLYQIHTGGIAEYYPASNKWNTVVSYEFEWPYALSLKS